jgi:hypothetical protein
MPLPVVSPTLFNAQALPADSGDTHLQPGVHLRVSANPLLGLPVAPFVVHRAVAKGSDLKLRTDAVFLDSLGAIVAPPFTLTPGNPVTAYLALRPGEVCLWAQVIADPFGGTPAGGTAPGAGLPTRQPVRPRVGRRPRPAGRLASTRRGWTPRGSRRTCSARRRRPRAWWRPGTCPPR